METKGTHLMLEYWSCDQEVLASVETITEMMLEAAAATGATVVKHHFQQQSVLKPGQTRPGVFGVAIVTESHLSIHTMPDDGYAAIDVYTCGTCVPARADKVFRRVLRSGPQDSMTLERGLGPGGRSIRVMNS